jgi:hypothetical protein
MIAFMLLSTIPLWFTQTPPLRDLIGHMGRYHVALEIGHNPVLAENWSYRWALIANLGADLLIMPIAWLIGLERAVWLVAAVLPPLMIWGVFRAARAVYGDVPPTAIATLPLALAYPYQFVIDADCTGDLRPALAKRIAQIPRGQFEYLWLLNFDRHAQPGQAGLAPAYQDEATVLYRLVDGDRTVAEPFKKGPQRNNCGTMSTQCLNRARNPIGWHYPI